MRTHRVDKLLEQHCYKSAAGLLQLVRFYMCSRVNFSCFLYRFYVGCDRCQGWFHGSCVSITQTEADNIDSYVCPKCKNTADNQDLRPLTEKDYESLKRIVRSLQVGSGKLPKIIHFY